MKFSKRVKEFMYKGVSLVLVMAVLAGVVMIPPKSSKAAVKTYRDNLVLEQGEGWHYYGLSSADSWKSSKPEVAIADMYGSIYGMKVGKATMTGKDNNNNNETAFINSFGDYKCNSARRKTDITSVTPSSTSAVPKSLYNSFRKMKK